jgi:hypothetical protein
MALHLPEGRHFAFGVERDQAAAVGHRRAAALVADLQLFAVHAQDAAMRLLLPSTPTAPSARP